MLYCPAVLYSPLFPSPLPSLMSQGISSEHVLLAEYEYLKPASVRPKPLLCTHRVWVSSGRLGMKWMSLQVILWSSQSEHSQKAEGHLSVPWLHSTSTSSNWKATGRHSIFALPVASPGGKRGGTRVAGADDTAPPGEAARERQYLCWTTPPPP